MCLWFTTSELFLGALEREQVWSTVVPIISGLYLGTPLSALQKAGLIQSMPQDHTIPAAQASLLSTVASHRVSCHVSSLSSPARLGASKDSIKL